LRGRITNSMIRNTLLLVAIAGLAAFAAGCGAGGSATPASTATQPAGNGASATSTPVIEATNDGYVITVHMSAPTGSFQVGQAVVESIEGGTRVTVDVAPPGDAAQPMHIHFGDCVDVGDVFFPLENVVRGHSVTVIEMPIEEVVMSSKLINVHRSYQDFPTYTACGELPDLP
jgi:hypothetical protein